MRDALAAESKSADVKIVRQDVKESKLFHFDIVCLSTKFYINLTEYPIWMKFTPKVDLSVLITKIIITKFELLK